MSYKLTLKEAQKLLDKLSLTYDIYAPKKLKAQGRYSDTDIIKYEKIKNIDEIEYREKSTYPMKEVISPIQQTIFYFTEDKYRESKVSTKPILVFSRACDINAIKVQTKIFIGNGGFVDYYYQRMYERIKFILMECDFESDTCFCVSMNANITNNYSLAVRFEDDGIHFEVKDKDFTNYFKGYPHSSFAPKFVMENKTKVHIPEIKDRNMLNKIKKSPMWKEYDKRCISCGACTIACSTCTCFLTRDLIYGDNSEVGERRRLSSSCQIDDFALVAGGGNYRTTAGDRMRYKVLHKFHDYKERFKDSHMCVGCGRCIERCPEYISITATVEKLNKEIERIEKEEASNV